MLNSGIHSSRSKACNSAFTASTASTMMDNENASLGEQLQVVPLREYVVNDRHIPPGSRTGFMLFLAEEVIPEFNVRTHEFYSRFCERKKDKKIFLSVLTKSLIGNEAKRRRPSAAFNVGPPLFLLCGTFFRSIN
eukprot:scaffold2433_cov85-Cylindrotheca_fusiformis.AAC.1